MNTSQSPERSGRQGPEDEPRVAALYHLHAPLVFRVALRLTQDRDEAEDVVQDVFLGLPEALASFEGKGSFEGWLRKIAVRVTLMRLRTLRRRRDLLRRATVPTAERAAGSTGATLDARLTLEYALGRLPAKLRAVFVLKEIEGLSHQEIGSLLGISATASETRLHRAREKLRRLLKGSA